jgi:hypothetical protein
MTDDKAKNIGRRVRVEGTILNESCHQYLVDFGVCVVYVSPKDCTIIDRRSGKDRRKEKP